MPAADHIAPVSRCPQISFADAQNSNSEIRIPKQVSKIQRLKIRNKDGNHCFEN